MSCNRLCKECGKMAARGFKSIANLLPEGNLGYYCGLFCDLYLMWICLDLSFLRVANLSIQTSKDLKKIFF